MFGKSKIEAAKAAIDPELSEFNPEPGTLAKTTEDLAWEEYQRKMKMFAAGLDREIQRMTYERAVRIGDTIIHETGLTKAVAAVFEEYRDKYLKAVE